MHHSVPTTLLTLLNKNRILHSPMQELLNGSDGLTSKEVYVNITMYSFSVACSSHNSTTYLRNYIMQ